MKTGEVWQRNDIQKPEYSEEEEGYRTFVVARLQDAKTRRDQAWPEFNDMDYQTWWVTNNKAGHSYIRPKQNQADTRVVTGTTEEKVNTLLSAALNNNFAPNVMAYDKYNLPLIETGKVMENMIKKSREIEDPCYDEFRIGAYEEFFNQGTVFIEERYLELRIPQKRLNKLDWAEVGDIKKISWETKFETRKQCQSVVIPGVNVYLGSMKEFYMSRQPYVFTREIITRGQAKALYGGWERWKNVPLGAEALFDTDDTSKPYNDYMKDVQPTKGVEDEKVEVIRYQDKWNNEFMVFLNGVMMLPIRFPLSALLGEADYTIAKGDAFPISAHFAYSKSVPAKTKVEQAVFDELMRLMVLKTQQSFQPPMANNTGKILSRNVLFPGMMTEDIDANKLKPLTDSRGVSPSEFDSLSFMKSIIDGKSVNPIMEGQAASGEQTAREIIELKQQSMQKMGLPILGLVNLERKLAWLRLKNIIQNWTSPVDKKVAGIGGELVDVFRNITVDTELEDGSKGQMIIQMGKGSFPDSGQVMAEEELLSRRFRKNTRKVYLSPKQLTSVTHTWFISVVPTQKENSELRVAMFNETIQAGYALFGPQSFNNEHIKSRWAILNGEDPSKMFLQQSPQNANGMVGQQEGIGTNINQQLTQGQRPQRTQKQQQGVNALVNA